MRYSIKKQHRIVSIIEIAIAILLVSGFYSGALAYTGFTMPLNGIRKSTGYSGFIPNRVISESENTAAHLSQDYVSTTDDWQVMSIYGGKVIDVHDALTDGAGRYVIIQHKINNVTFYSEYQHLLCITVSNWQDVYAGQTIGMAGRSGTKENQYDRHLHIAIYTGRQDAWAPRLTSFPVNVVHDGPIEYDGTTYYNPDRILNGIAFIPGTEATLSKYPFESLYDERAIVKGKGERASYNIKKYPYDSDEEDDVTIGTYSTEEFTIDRVVKNKYGNNWYHVIKKGNNSIDGFIWSGGVNWVRDDRQISWENNSLYGANIKAGNGYEVTGTIQSSNPITKIEAYVILNNIAGPFKPAQTVTFDSNVYSYSLGNSPINTGIKFAGYTTAGEYTLRLVITYKNKLGGSTSQYTLNTPFTISSAGGTSQPSDNTTSINEEYRIKQTTTKGLYIRPTPSGASDLGLLYYPTTIHATKKTNYMAGGYYWLYGTTSTGVSGWIAYNPDWIERTDISAPTISGIQVYEVSSEGYTVSCNVSGDVNKVSFPTWTVQNGQDDIFQNWGNSAIGTLSSGVAVYRVNTKDHNNETDCDYCTHIYAYGPGGSTSADAGITHVPSPTVPTTGITLDRSSVDVDLASPGDLAFALVATVLPSNATNKSVHWSSSNQSVARVDDYGNVTPTSVGSAVITAMAEDGGYQATCTVNISTWINGIGLSAIEAELDLAEHETLQLTKTITPTHATNKNVKWESTNPSVATVSSNGLVTPISEGVAVITCTALDPGAFCSLCLVSVVNNETIEPVKVSSIALNRTVYEFSNSSEGSIELKATISPEDAADKNVTWASSNNNVARVVNGRVTPVAAGYARITCESPDGPVGVCDIVVHADRIRRLPRSLKAVEAEVFYGTALQEVILPEGVTSIDSRAFANCGSLVLIDVPVSVRSIASDAFSGSDVAIVCEGSCYATEYASSRGIPYIIGAMPREVVISTDKTSLLPGQSANLQAQVAPDDAPGTIRWQIVEGGNNATIKAEGNRCALTATGAGHVTVSATAINGTVRTVDISITEHPTTFAVGFDANGGSADMDYMTAEFDAPVGTLPTARRDYHTFEGWYTQANGGRRITADTVFSDYNMGNLMLYAHWTENPWSEWVTEDELPSGTIQKESKQQYRYQDKAYSDWSAWGPWTVERESTGELKRENQATVYYWYYDLCQNCGRHSPFTVCWDCGHSIGQNWRVAWFDTPKSAGGQFGNSGKVFKGTSQYDRWFFWTDDNGNGDSRTGYQYSTRTYSWGEWSGWSDTAVSGTSTRNVQTRTMYRYRAK